MSLPSADDLFRPTVVPDNPEDPEDPEDRGGSDGSPADPAAAPATGSSIGASVELATGTSSESEIAEESDPQPAAGRRSRPSGRVRHDEKMTVYVTADELLDLEHARLTLRRSTGQAVDRGRLVREAVAIALADLDRNGEDSVLFQRLTQS